MMGVELIAEIGWNHMGDMGLAARMIEAAVGAGADYVKFQTWKVARLIDGPWDTDGRRQIYEKAELSRDDHYYLKSECDKRGVKFLSSIFSVKDLDFLRGLCDEVKIPSPEVCEEDLVLGCIENFKRVFISTGALTADEFEKALSYLEHPNVWMLHCVSCYPCAHGNVNLPKFLHMMGRGERVGYSGHLSGTHDAIAAICHGAKVIEKHFTVDHELPGRDNQFAVLPEEFRTIHEFRINYAKMMQAHGLGMQDCEGDYRRHQKGRWNGHE